MPDLNLPKCPTPNCRAAPGDLRLVHNTESHYPLESGTGSELIVADCYFTDPADGHKPRLLCLKCGQQSALPKGLTVVHVRDGKRTRMFTIE